MKEQNEQINRIPDRHLGVGVTRTRYIDINTIIVNPFHNETFNW